MAVTVRRSYSGNAPPTTLTSGINASVLTIVMASATGYPTGSGGPFFIVINRGGSTEEKVRCTSISGATVTVEAGGRGADGTTAATHVTGEIIEHCYTAFDADEANAHSSDAALDNHTQYLTTARHDVEAARHDLLAWGKLGYAQVTAPQAGISATVDLTGLTTTVTVGTDRTIEITAQCILSNTAEGTEHQFYISEGATFLQGSIQSGSNGAYLTHNSSVVLTPTAGAHTYKLRAAGVGSTCNMQASATTPAFILVKDIGPA